MKSKQQHIYYQLSKRPSDLVYVPACDIMISNSKLDLPNHNTDFGKKYNKNFINSIYKFDPRFYKYELNLNRNSDTAVVNFK